MKLIVGLGNPGLLYAGTRHNIGFQAVKYLARSQRIKLKKEKGALVLSGKGKIGSFDSILALPLTFMNLSGQAVKFLLGQYRIKVTDLLIICDDLDLEFGRIRICSGGSSAGHRGTKSVISCLKTDEFDRLRIGIGRPGRGEASDFVLSKFNRKEKPLLSGIIEKSAQCCREWAENGVKRAMNNFNRKDK